MSIPSYWPPPWSFCAAWAWHWQRTASKRCAPAFATSPWPRSPFLFLFLFASDTSRLVTSSEAESAGEASWEGSERPPVVFLVLDEFPLASIINSDGQVNEERFPNFARLVHQSDWFRNASSNASLTEYAVPSLLTGAGPSTDLLPIASDYPDNLFTLLGSKYDVWEYQVFTDLCPEDICTEGGPGGRRGGVIQALKDTTVVYRHLVLPESMRDDLPRIDQSWNEFIIDDGEDLAVSGFGAASEAGGSGVEEPDSDDKWHGLGPEGRAATAQASVIEELTADLDADAESRLWFAHVALPHAPWTITPMGNELADSTSRSKYKDLTDEQKEWSARLSRQLHLLQAGATDQKLGELINRLEELSIWESALVVVAADHGTSFLPPDVGRSPTEGNAHAIFRVPMFVKQPGQTEGSVRDDNAITLDLLPSIADLLSIDTEWPFDGHSLFDGSAYPDEKRLFAGPNGPKYVSTSFDEFIDTVVAEHERDFPRADWIGVAAIGRHAGLVGEDASGLNAFYDSSISVDVSQAEELAALDLGAGVVPALIQGTLHLPDGEPPPDELLLVLNARVGGVAGGLVQTDGGWSFAGIVAEQFFVDGENTLNVLIPRADGSFSRARG